MHKIILNFIKLIPPITLLCFIIQGCGGIIEYKKFFYDSPNDNIKQENPPELNAIPDQPLVWLGYSIEPIEALDVNTGSNVNIDGDPIFYECRFDLVQDDYVDWETAYLCSGLEENAISFNFHQDLGTMNWSPSSIQTGTYEFKIRGTSNTLFDESIFKITIFINDFTWTGGGGNENWNNGLNWYGGSSPSGSDTAIFLDGIHCHSNCSPTINSDIEIKGLYIHSNYTGEITQALGKTITIGLDGIIQDGGTFLGGNSLIDISGDFILHGGTFKASSGKTKIGRYTGNNIDNLKGFTITEGSFLHNNGTIEFDGRVYSNCAPRTATLIDVANTVEFYNMTVNISNGNSICSGIFRNAYLDIAPGNTIIIHGALYHNDGYLRNGTIKLYGNIENNCSDPENYICAEGGNTQLELVGSNNQVYSAQPDAPRSMRTIINKTNGIVSPGSIDFAFGELEVLSGHFVAPTGTLKVGYSYDSYNNPKGFTVTPESVFDHNSGTLVFNGTVYTNCSGGIVTTINVDNSLMLNNLEVSITNSSYMCSGYFRKTILKISETDSLVVLGNFVFNEGTIDGGVIDVRGNAIITCNDPATFECANGGTTKLTFSGSNPQFIVNSNSGILPSGTFTIDKTGEYDLLTLDSNISFSQSVDLLRGSLDLNNFDLSIGNLLTINIGGNIRCSGGNLTYGNIVNNGTIECP